MYIKHSKFKNTGILFEILVKKITGDTLSGKTSPAIKIIKEYFVNTELGKEYKLYETLFQNKKLTESKANLVLSTVLEQSKKLNRTKLKNEKYNLIKELKSHYDVEDLFKTKLVDYKAQASLYTLLEIYNTAKSINPNQIVENKINILEHITNQEVDAVKIKDVVLEEFKSYDKDLRTLTYHVLLENFNQKYNNLNSKQKLILKEFINSVDNGPLLKEFYNKEVLEIKEKIKSETKKVKDKVTKIKLQEIDKLIVELNKRTKVKNSHLVDLLQYHTLLEELTVANG
jgi:adenine-specific DNA methylase